MKKRHAIVIAILCLCVGYLSADKLPQATSKLASSLPPLPPISPSDVKSPSLGKQTQEDADKSVYKLGRVEVASKSSPISNPSLDIVDKGQLEDTDAHTIPEALSFVTGVRGESLRGYSFNYVGFYIDGVPINEYYKGMAEWNMFMVDDIEEIQISKGYTSPNYGVNNMGGAINFITSRPHKTFEIDLGGGWVSPSGHREHIKLGGAYDKWYYQISVNNYMRDYYDLPHSFRPTPVNPTHRRVGSKMSSQHYSLKLGITPNARDEYSFNLSYMHSSSENPPDVIDGGEVGKEPFYDKITAYFLSKSYVNKMLGIRFRFSYDTFHNRWQNGPSVDANGSWSPPSDGGRWGFNSDFNDYSLGGNLSFILTPTRRDALTLSLNVQNNNHKSERYKKDGSLSEAKRTTSDITTSLALEYGHDFDSHIKFLFSASYENNTGLRMEARDKGAQDHGSFTNTRHKNQSMNGYGLQALISYTPNAYVDTYFSLSKKDYIPGMKWRYPSSVYPDEVVVSNPSLQTESSFGPDFGIGFNPLSSLRISLHAYYSLKFNELTSEQWKEGSIDYTRYINDTHDNQYFGVEASLRTSFYHDIFHLRFNYTFIGDPTGKYTGTPANLFNLIAKVTPTKNIDLVAALRYEQAYKDYYYTGSWGNRIKHSYTQPAYANVNLRAAYRVPQLPGFEIVGGINNLTDEYFYEGFTPQQPDEGRSYYIEARYRY